MSKAAKKLGFKDSTARFIYTKYKTEGVIYESCEEKKVKRIIENYEKKKSVEARSVGPVVEEQPMMMMAQT